MEDSRCRPVPIPRIHGRGALSLTGACSAITAFHKYPQVTTRRGATPCTFATSYALLGDKEKALHYLDEAFASHDDALTGIKVDRELDVLHADPRYVTLLKHMGLPQ